MDATWLDLAIGWVFPARGAARLQHRRVMQALGYEGAKTGRRTDGWITASNSADGESQIVVSALRDRARDLVRNNPYAARALDVKVANTIGTGIVPEVKNKRLAPIWSRFIDTCDADGRLDLYGLQALIERCRSESGEVIVRWVPTRKERGGGSFKLRVLEPDFLDHSRDGRAPETDNQIRYGIEYDATGGVVAYWLHDSHPGDGATLSLGAVRGRTSQRVPAAEIIHLFRKARPGQSRGVTDFAPVMLRARDLDDYDDAEVMRKKIEACLAVFVTTGSGMSDASVGPVAADAKGRIESLFPGMIEYLKLGESVTMADPKASGGYADFQRFTLRAVAAGYGVPYELMTGDLSQVNYSSYRAGLVDFRRRIEQDQWQLHVAQVCARIWDWFLADVTAASPGMGDRTTVEWTPPRFELIDPLKETQAELEACLAGFDTWDEIVRRRGWTASEQLDRIAKWQRDLAAKGVVLKSDFRSQIAAQAPAPNEPGKDEEAAA